MMEKSQAFILWFDQLGIEDVPLVGGKNASLGEMYRELSDKGVKVPNGFAITAHAYHYLLEKNGAKEQIKNILADLDTNDMENLTERGHKVRALIRSLEFPPELRDAIYEAYHHLGLQYGENPDVAVRSSATAEDLPDASFAGQQETYLNVRGEDALIEACKKCFASLFTNRAISYRQDKGFDHFSIGLSIGVQKMVRSDLASSGVMFSIDTESGFENVVFITAAWGLGENVVQGAVNPDEYYVFKPTLYKGFRSIISKEVGSKEKKMIYDLHGNKATKNVPVPKEEQRKFCLTDDEILTLARWACTIEEHYSRKAGKYKPMDMEWAKDGESGELFIVQARPETVHSQRAKNVYQTYHLETSERKVLVTGHSVGKKIGEGMVNVIKDVKDIGRFQDGAVLVTEMTDPDWEPIMKKAAAIVTNSGGRTCHAAIISRELGIPCVVGCGNATEVLQDGQDVTVDCSQGDEGYVYEGKLPYKVEEINLDKMPRTKTKIMMIIGTPEQAFEFSQIPNEGVGLARMEFIINSYIRIHPLALIEYPHLDPDVKEKIEKLTYGYEDKKAYFVDRLAHGIGRIAAAFYPKPVIVRMSDFKTNEYANLIGGQKYEPKEDNPMIGWRGASRYYDPKYEPGFALECAALKRVREEYGLTNVIAMIPFCRTVEEAQKVVATMAKYGLRQGDGFKIYGMCEIPSNVILADEFLNIFDGFSIGSNDLTQLTLGLDRDAGMLAHIGNERNEAVKKLIAQVIEVANRRGKYIGICGQGPSDFPDFAEFLVEKGIQSIALNPDTVIPTTMRIAEKERNL